MINYSLGEFEELILLVVAGSDGEAYGVAIQEKLAGHLKKNVNISAVHVSQYELRTALYKQIPKLSLGR